MRPGEQRGQRDRWGNSATGTQRGAGVPAVARRGRAALQAYTTQGMTDPSLLGQLSSVRVPVLVVWGAADRIYPPEHGEAFAKAIPGARLVLLDEAGHLPQLEAPSALLAAVLDFTR